MKKKTLKRTTNIAVLASGKGTNFAAIARSIGRGYLKKVSLKLLVTDKRNALVRIRAKRFGVPEMWIDPARYKTPSAYDKKLIDVFKKEKIDLIVLAGYMKILTPGFVKKFRNKIVNIHPALLPSFKGAHAITDAYNYGVKITGVTVHFVDEFIDHGPIIAQRTVSIRKKETVQSLEARIHRIEHKLYPEVIKKIVGKKIKVRRRHVVFV